MAKIENMQLQHVAFICENIERMEEYYSSIFGFTRARVFNEGQNNEFFILKCDNVRIELFPKKEGMKYGKGKFKHFAVSVNSLNSTIEYLNLKNIKVDNIIDYSTEGNVFKICFVTDPEGNVIEFMEGYKDKD